ncbi:PH domain-containing protein [Myxococcaceae bacterium GXIMD 01537]
MDDAAFDRLKLRVTAITRPQPALLTYYLVVAALTVVGFPFVMLPLYFRYHTLRYRFDEEGLSVAHGILFRREVHLTYARMQDIHLKQNVLERWLGIGTVTVQTAGASDAGDVPIEGVRQFEAIRDYLYARMRGVREPRAPALEGDSALLASIRDELRAAARALGAPEREK